MSTKIKHGLVSKRTSIHAHHAHHLAHAIRNLVSRFEREYGDEEGPCFEETLKFGSFPEYEAFMDAAVLCGFVCCDFSGEFPLEDLHAMPEDNVPTLTLIELRYYLHTLVQYQRHSSHPLCGALIKAIRSGALSRVATRLDSDQSLYLDP